MDEPVEVIDARKDDRVVRTTSVKVIAPSMKT